MAPEVFTGAWAEAWCAEINASEAYREAAAEWEGAIVLRVSADPSFGLPEARAVRMDLWHGECRGASAAPSDDGSDAADAADVGDDAPYLIEADPYSWKRVLEGELDPIAGLMRGKLKLRRGSVVALARYVGAARELVRTAGRVETSFPEGWD